MNNDKIDYLKGVLKSIENNTQPINGHSDPRSISDCWNEVYDLINGIYGNIVIDDKLISDLCQELNEYIDLQAHGNGLSEVKQIIKYYLLPHKPSAIQVAKELADIAGIDWNTIR